MNFVVRKEEVKFLMIYILFHVHQMQSNGLDVAVLLYTIRTQIVLHLIFYTSYTYIYIYTRIKIYPIQNHHTQGEEIHEQSRRRKDSPAQPISYIWAN